jgi:hypothetical protein
VNALSIYFSAKRLLVEFFGAVVHPWTPPQMESTAGLSEQAGKNDGWDEKEPKIEQPPFLDGSDFKAV